MMNNATVVNIEKLPDCLFRIWIKPDWHLENITWFAGQFLRLGIIEPGFDSKSLRAMTIIDIQDNIFEFFMVSVTDGVTSPRVSQLNIGDRCYLESKITGNFTLQNIPITNTTDLWMCGTGTGIAPYLAMLITDGSILDRCNNIILVHSVRSDQHLCYQNEIDNFKKRYSQFHYVPVVTRDLTTHTVTCLRERIPELIENKKLTAFTNIEISPKHSFFMLCGVPGMIGKSTVNLQAMGFNKHRRRTPGQILTERYF